MKASVPTPSGGPVQVTVEGDSFRVETPEGTRVRTPVATLLQKVVATHSPPSGVIIPDGVRSVFRRGRTIVLVHESPALVRRLKWIAADSPAPFGPEATYRDVSLALPYVIVFAVFERDPQGRLILSDRNEAFFRTRPLTSPDDELCYPALLNCSKFESPEGRPLAWICTQYLRRRLGRKSDDNACLRLGLEALLSCLFETGFNYSSEHHELTSWFSESRAVDERVSSVEAWERASTEERFFALDVPWLETGKSIHDVVERIFKNNSTGPTLPTDVGSLAGFITNHAEQSVPPASPPSPPSNLTTDPEFPF